jgi:phage terminase large subunit
METKIINIPAEFKRLFDSDWREAAVWGGRYSLKSHTVARFLLIKARQQKTRVACFREFQNSIADSSHHLLSHLIKEYNLNDFEITNNSIINRINGSDFIFKGLCHNEQNVKSTEGIDIAWVEEAQTVSNDSLEILTPTVRKPNSQIIYTYNRIYEDDPVHRRLVVEGRPNTLKINVNYDIAIKYGMMPDVILKEIEDDKKNRPALYKSKWLGEPASIEQRIYSDWKIIDEIPHEARLERYGLDFGYRPDPAAIVGIYYYNGGWIVDEVLYRQEVQNHELANTFKSLPEKLVIADCAEPKSIDEIRSYGINIQGCKKGKDSKKFGIKLLQGQPVSITKRSVNGIKEYYNYLWSVDKNGVVILGETEGKDHFLDAMRYGMETLGRLKQELSYWDRIWKDELQGTTSTKSFNKER